MELTFGTHRPLIGALNNPASEYPNVFGGIKLFEEFPYFLPCAIAGTLSLFVFIFALFDLKEVWALQHPLLVLPNTLRSDPPREDS